MNKINETIFDYTLTDLEQEVLDLPFKDVNSYLHCTTLIERLNDLHLLFLMRMDKMNGNRIMDLIKEHDKKYKSLYVTS